MEIICSNEKLTQDIDGNLLNLDEQKQYDSFTTNEFMVNMIIDLFINHSTITTTLPENNNHILNGTYSSGLAPELASLQDILNKFDPSQNLELYHKLLLQNSIIVCAYLFIIVVSLFGNLPVLFIILARPRVRNHTSNKLIANLTFSDLLLTIFNIPLTVVRLLFDSWPLGSLLCQLGPMVQALSVYVSTNTVVVIGLHRHHVLLGSLSSSIFSSTLSNGWTIGFIWLLSTVQTIPHFICNHLVHKQSYTCMKRCEAIYSKPAQYYSRAITIFTVLGQYLVPLTIIVICYTKIGIHIWRRGQIGVMTPAQKLHNLRARKRTIKMLILVVLVFGICWLPLNLYQIYLEFMQNSKHSRTIFAFCHWFGASSVCINPFIYFLLNKQQHNDRALRRILKMCFPLNRCLNWNGMNNRSSASRRPSGSFWSVDNVTSRSFGDNRQIFVTNITTEMNMDIL